MCKYVILKVGNGGFLRDGFPVEVRVGEDGQPAYPLSKGQLPPLPELRENYQRWQSSYRSRGLPMRIELIEGEPTQVSDTESAKALANTLNDWLNSEQFRTVKEDLLTDLHRSEQIRFVVETKEPLLWQLPWHKWDLFNRYSKAEVAFSPDNTGNLIEKVATPGGKVRILAIEGDSSGINTRKDRQEIENLADAEAVFLKNPKPETICDRLWEESWDILFFAGHSSSSSDRNTGQLQLDLSNSLAIPDIRNALTEAIGKGLKLAIFNSCDGLGLAKNLAELHIPQIIFMREPVPDEFAQRFLKDFLQAFSGGESLYASVQEARKKQELWEKRCPGVTWVPVIFQNNPEIAPPTWTQLRDSSLRIEKQEIEKQEIEKQEIEKQEIEKQEIEKQESLARPRPKTKSSSKLLPVQKQILAGALGAASLVYFWSLWRLLPLNNDHGIENNYFAQTLEKTTPDSDVSISLPIEDSKELPIFSKNSSISNNSAFPEILVPPVQTGDPVANLAKVLGVRGQESYLIQRKKIYYLLPPSSPNGSSGLSLDVSGQQQNQLHLAATVSNYGKTPLGLNDSKRLFSFLVRKPAPLENPSTVLPSKKPRNANVWDRLKSLNFFKLAGNRQQVKPSNTTALALGRGELGWARWARQSSDISDRPEQGSNSLDLYETLALTLVQIAGQLVEAGRPEQAAQILDLAQKFAEKIDDSSARATVLAKIAGKYAEAGQPELTYALLKQAEDIVQNIEEPLKKAAALAAIASEYAGIGDVRQAIEAVKEAFALAQEGADPYEQIRIFTEIAGAALKVGDSQQAFASIDEAEPLISEVLKPRARAPLAKRDNAASQELINPLTRLAKVASEAGDPQQATEIIEQIGAIAETIANPGPRARAFAQAAITVSELGNWQQTAEIVEQALPLLPKIANPLERIHASTLLAKAASKVGNEKQVAAIIDETLPVAFKIASPVQQVRALADVALTASEAGNQQQTTEIIAKALPLVSEMTNPSQKAGLLTVFAKASSKVGNEEKATQIIEETLAIADQFADPAVKVTSIAEVVSAALNTNNADLTEIVLNRAAQIALQYKPSPPLTPAPTISSSDSMSLWDWFSSNSSLDKDVEDVEISVEWAEKAEENNLSWANDSSGNYFLTASLDIAETNNYGLSNFCDTDAGQQSDCNLLDSVSNTKDMLDCLQDDSCVDITELSNEAKKENIRVPEPSSTAGIMILGGLGAIATLKRKRKQEK